MFHDFHDSTGRTSGLKYLPSGNRLHTMENQQAINWKTHHKSQCLIAMLNYQRVQYMGHTTDFL